MNIEIRDLFIGQWKKYFNNAELPVPEKVLSFSVPMIRFTKMIGYMDESFLITESWKKVQKRIN